jgi:thymidine kinase
MQSGKITLIIGPMMSGKSTELQRRVRRLRIAGVAVCAITHPINTRDPDTHLHTHDKTALVMDGKFESIGAWVATYYALSKESGNPVRVLAIDEGQFFPDLVPEVQKLANQGLHIIVAGCDRLDSGLPFNDLYKLVLDAEEVLKFTAVCDMCRSEQGIYSQRRNIPLCDQIDKTLQQQLYDCLLGSPIVPGRLGRPLVITPGGADLYMTICRPCLVSHLIQEATVNQ